MEILAPKGLYDEEQVVLNRFLVSVDVARLNPENYVENYMDYSLLCSLIKDVFLSEEKLLEKLAQNILLKIQNQWSEIHAVKILIRKVNPAFEGISCQSVHVRLDWMNEDI